MSIVFCSKCHQEVYRIIEKDGTMKVIQGNNTLFSINDKSSIDIKLNCSQGHPVKLIIKPKEAVNA